MFGYHANILSFNLIDTPFFDICEGLIDSCDNIRSHWNISKSSKYIYTAPTNFIILSN